MAAGKPADRLSRQGRHAGSEARATGLIGVIAVLVGLGQFVDAYKAGFRKDLKRGQMSKQELRIADFLGRFGMFSRGVIFSMLGAFIIQAALPHATSHR